jgi:carbonic anhydrase/acetyltransferase-like protein (isoleucine patch superfamily)
MMHDYNGILPSVHETVFIAEGVQLIGDVAIAESSSVWYNAVLRGDLAPVRIGRNVNIQDGAIGHVNSDQPLVVEDHVSVGHGAIIHGCTIGRGSLIGMGAILLNGVELGEFAMIGAGSVVTENKTVPAYTLSIGSPARVVRELTDQDLQRMKRTTESYVQKAKEFLEGRRRS